MNDTYSVLLFLLYLLKNNPEYNTLSELIYVVDKDNLINLLQFYGGMTVTFPTITELEELIKSLELYTYVEQDKLSVSKALKKCRVGTERDRKKYLKIYEDICKAVQDYDITIKTD